MRIQMIYMAAGNSRRFGSNKLLYPIDGKSMFLHGLERLHDICKRHSEWRVILVSQYEEILQKGKPYADQLVYSPESRQGASYTIKNGITAAKDGEAYVFFTADQPWMGEATIEGFLETMEEKACSLGCVCWKETPGNPVWFSKEYVPELLALEEDQGGRKVLKKYPDRVCYYPVAEARELEDVDYKF